MIQCVQCRPSSLLQRPRLCHLLAAGCLLCWHPREGRVLGCRHENKWRDVSLPNEHLNCIVCKPSLGVSQMCIQSGENRKASISEAEQSWGKLRSSPVTRSVSRAAEILHTGLQRAGKLSLPCPSSTHLAPSCPWISILKSKTNQREFSTSSLGWRTPDQARA